MKNNEIEIMDFESEVEILGAESTDVSILGNEYAFMVDVDDFSVYGETEFIGADMQHGDDVDSF